MIRLPGGIGFGTGCQICNAGTAQDVSAGNQSVVWAEASGVAEHLSRLMLAVLIAVLYIARAVRTVMLLWRVPRRGTGPGAQHAGGQPGSGACQLTALD